VWVVSVAMIGYLTRPLAAALRVGLGIAGVCMLVPAEIGTWAAWTDVAGFALALVFLGHEYVDGRRRRIAGVETVPSE
jgi:hypothetical protein